MRSVQKPLSRRDFLRMAGTLAAGTTLAACAPKTVIVEKEVEKTVVVEKEVEKVVKETVMVEGTPKVVEKKVTQIVKEVVTATPAPEEPVHLSVVMAGEGEELRQNVKPFMEKNPYIEVEIIGVPSEGYDQKVDLLIAGGDPPSLWYPLVSRDFTYYAVRELLADNLPFVELDSFALSDFFESAIAPLYWGGTQLVGLPSSNFIAFIAYNKDLFDAAGVPYPPSSWEDTSWTWDEFLARAKALTVLDEDPMKTIWGFGGGLYAPYAPQYFGGNMWDEKAYETYSPTTSQITSEPVVETYKFMQDLIWKHKVQPDPEANSAFYATTQSSFFMSGKAAMNVRATWNLNLLGTIEDFEWGIAPFPVNQWNGSRTILYGGVWCTFKHPHQAAVWELLKFFVSPEAIRLDFELRDAGLTDSGVTMGGMPGRISMAKEWTEWISKGTGIPVKVIEEVNNKGMDYAFIFQSLGSTKWPEILDVAMQPELDKILRNQTTVEEAVQRMDTKINEILAAK